MMRQKNMGWGSGLLILFWIGISACADYPSGPPAPSVGADTYTTVEDTVLTVAADKGVLVNDDPKEGSVLKLLTTGPMDTENSGQVDLAADGSFVYTPPPDFNGTDSLVYSVQNQAGEKKDGVLSVTVTPVNDPPTAKDDSLTVEEDAAGEVNLLANDSDVDPGDELTVVGIIKPVNGTVVDKGGGVVRYTPKKNFNGDDVFHYTVSDKDGEEASARVTVIITPDKDSPLARDDSFTTAEETPLNQMDVLKNDSDPDGDPLTVASVASPSQFNAIVTINADHTLNYVPALNFFGSDTFTYTLTTPDGSSSAATVTVTVTPVNDPPVAVNDALTTAEDTAATVNVLANDSDPDGDALTVSRVGKPTHGTAVINADYTITYTPKKNYDGPDSFTYTLTANGESVDARVAVTVTAVDDPPEAVNDSLNTAEDTAAVVNVLANDSDPERDALTVSSVTQPAHGTATIIANRVTYTPIADYFGSDSFIYTVTANGKAATATVAVTVSPVNDKPSFAAADPPAVNEDAGAQSIAGWAHDFDPGPDNESTQTLLRYEVEMNDDDQDLFDVEPDVATNGTLTYTPAPDASGTASFTVTATDSGGTANGGVNTSDLRTFTIRVTAVNDSPVLNIDQLELETYYQQTVADILPPGAITDPDGVAVEAMAVTAVDNRFGYWQYWTGQVWAVFSNRLGEIVELSDYDAVRLLGSDSRISFTPVNIGFAFDTYFEFRAWDQSSGTTGGTADLTVIGGTTAFSVNEARATVEVYIEIPPGG